MKKDMRHVVAAGREKERDARLYVHFSRWSLFHKIDPLGKNTIDDDAAIGAWHYHRGSE